MTSEARFLVNLFAEVAIWGGIVGVCVFAWLKGRPAERYGSAVFTASSVGAFAFELLTGQDIPLAPEMFMDTGVAAAFLLLAIRYNNLWLGAAMIVKGLQLALHATHLTDMDDQVVAGFNLYTASLNLIAIVILFIFLTATITSIRLRSRARREASVAALAGVELAASGRR
jgi:hypothetical protein